MEVDTTRVIDILLLARAFWESPLHLLVRSNCLDEVRSLLGPYTVNVVDTLGRTPLHVAVRHGHSDMVALLLEFNADPNVRCVHGNTPLLLALKGCFLDAVTQLLRNPNIDVSTADNHGWTAADWAYDSVTKKSLGVDEVSDVVRFCNMCAVDDFGYISYRHGLHFYRVEIRETAAVVSTCHSRYPSPMNAEGLSFMEDLLREKDSFRCGVALCPTTGELRSFSVASLCHPNTIQSAVETHSQYLNALSANPQQRSILRKPLHSVVSGFVKISTYPTGRVATMPLSLNMETPRYSDILLTGLRRARVLHGCVVQGFSLDVDGNLHYSETVPPNVADEVYFQGFEQRGADFALALSSIGKTKYSAVNSERLRYFRNLRLSGGLGYYVRQACNGPTDRPRKIAVIVADDALIPQIRALTKVLEEVHDHEIIFIPRGPSAFQAVVCTLHGIELSASCGNITSMAFHFAGPGTRIMSASLSDSLVGSSEFRSVAALMLSEASYLDIPTLRRYTVLLARSVLSVRFFFDCDFSHCPPPLCDPSVYTECHFASEWLSKPMVAPGEDPEWRLPGWGVTPPNAAVVLASRCGTLLHHEVEYPLTSALTVVFAHDDPLLFTFVERLGSNSQLPDACVITADALERRLLGYFGLSGYEFGQKTFSFEGHKEHGGEGIIQAGYLMNMLPEQRLEVIGENGAQIGLVVVTDVEPYRSTVKWLWRSSAKSQGTCYVRAVTSADSSMECAGGDSLEVGSGGESDDDLPVTQVFDPIVDAEDSSYAPEPPPPETHFLAQAVKDDVSRGVQSELRRRALPEYTTTKIQHDFLRRVFEVRGPETRMSSAFHPSPSRSHGPRRIMQLDLTTLQNVHLMCSTEEEAKGQHDAWMRRFYEALWVTTREEELHFDYAMTYPSEKVFESAEAQLSREVPVLNSALQQLGWKEIVAPEDEDAVFKTCAAATRLHVLEYLYRKPTNVLMPWWDILKRLHSAGTPSSSMPSDTAGSRGGGRGGLTSLQHKVLTTRYAVLLREGVMHPFLPNFPRVNVQSLFEHNGYIHLAKVLPTVTLSACSRVLLYHIEVKGVFLKRCQMFLDALRVFPREQRADIHMKMRDLIRIPSVLAPSVMAEMNAQALERDISWALDLGTDTVAPATVLHKMFFVMNFLRDFVVGLSTPPPKDPTVSLMTSVPHRWAERGQEEDLRKSLTETLSTSRAYQLAQRLHVVCRPLTPRYRAGGAGGVFHVKIGAADSTAVQPASRVWMHFHLTSGTTLGLHWAGEASSTVWVQHVTADYKTCTERRRSDDVTTWPVKVWVWSGTTSRTASPEHVTAWVHRSGDPHCSEKFSLSWVVTE